MNFQLSEALTVLLDSLLSVEKYWRYVEMVSLGEMIAKVLVLAARPTKVQSSLNRVNDRPMRSPRTRE